MQNFFKVVSQTQPVTITKQDGTQSTKCSIVLQELGGKYTNSYAATLLGNIAQCRFYPNDLVLASLRFSHREYNGNLYQDVTVQDIISFTQH